MYLIRNTAKRHMHWVYSNHESSFYHERSMTNQTSVLNNFLFLLVVHTVYSYYTNTFTMPAVWTVTRSTNNYTCQRFMSCMVLSIFFHLDALNKRGSSIKPRSQQSLLSICFYYSRHYLRLNKSLNKITPKQPAKIHCIGSNDYID